jgi:hypothetical protein
LLLKEGKYFLIKLIVKQAPLVIVISVFDLLLIINIFLNKYDLKLGSFLVKIKNDHNQTSTSKIVKL